MNKITSTNTPRFMIPTSNFWLLLILLSSFLAGCDNPTDTTEKLNVDRDIPPSENFDASYGFWGPEGSTIYFTHSEELGTDPDPGKLDQLWKMDLKTRQRQKIRDGRILNADISPDGEWFVFQSFAVPQYLFKMRSDGTDLQQLTGPGSPNPEWKQTGLGRWSPNGNKILFSVAGEPCGVALMDKNGSNPNIFIPFGVHANWFPSGNRIAYVNYDTTQVRSQQQQVYIAKADGGNPQKKTNLENTFFNINAPSLSPDSPQIVFIYNDEVYIKNVDGGDAEQVTAGAGYAARPEWSPDGQTILFSRIILNGPERLYYLNVATREVTPVFPQPKMITPTKNTYR